MLEERESNRRKMAGKRLAKLTQANKTAIFGFAEAPEPNRRKERKCKLSFKLWQFCKYFPEAFSAPVDIP